MVGPRVAVIALVAAAAAAGCPGSGPTPPTGPAAGATTPTSTAGAAADGPMADPAEYAIDRVSWAAGQAIFTRTGLGDPYRVGVPYPLYLALVERYPDLFGGDLGALAARYGMLARAADPASADRDVRAGLPVGLHLTDDPITGVPFVVHNCTLCHAERVRWTGGEALVIGLGNRRLRLHDYDAAFAAVTRRPDFDVAHLRAAADAIAAARGVPWPYDWRQPLTTATIAALRTRARDRADFHARVTGGPPGRIATIESFALAMAQRLGHPVPTGADVGWAKIPDVVGFAARTTLSFDGVGEGPMDVLVVEADFAAGARPAWFTSHPLQGASLAAYLRQPERDLPFPGPIDRALAARGAPLFEFHCAPCHGRYGADGRVRAYREEVVDLDDLGTDPARALAVSDAFVDAAADPRLAPGLPAGTLRTRRTGGYVPPVLTSVWAHAPYGHAGQWASLAMLATAPAARPTRYVVDLAAPYDLVRVGVPLAAAAGPATFVHDGARPGLSVLGHPFLSDVGADAAAVIEYLKTL